MKILEKFKKIFNNIKPESPQSDSSPNFNNKTHDGSENFETENKEMENRFAQRAEEQKRLEERWEKERLAAIKRVEEHEDAKKRLSASKIESQKLKNQQIEGKRFQEQFAEQQRVEELNKIYSNENERLINNEEEARSINSSILTNNIPSPIVYSHEVFPKKCLNCPDHKNYLKGEIHQCPDCGEWICGRHYHGHVIKKHGSREYRVQSSDVGQSSFKFPK